MEIVDIGGLNVKICECRRTKKKMKKMRLPKMVFRRSKINVRNSGL